MKQDLNKLLKTLQDLNRAADAGKLSREQLEAEVKKMTATVKETIASVSKQLPAEMAGASAMLVDVFKMQLSAIARQSGMDMEQNEEMKKLSAELDLLKRSHIKS
jgi:hypothetical protein